MDHPIPAIDRYAVIGYPVAHSRSPQIHQQFAELTGERLIYGRIPAPAEKFAELVAEFRDSRGRGLNVTLPHKERAFALCDELSERARLAGAVNTLKFEADRVYGDNTDGAGLVRDLTINLGLSLRGKKLLLLGAGGAARGILGPLLAEQPEGIVLVNRTVAKAEALAARFAALGKLQGCGYTAIKSQAFDLILNATSASVGGELPTLPQGLVTANTAIYDLFYASEATPFMRWGKAGGAALVADGLGMLVEQAAESFYLWRGLRPPTPTILASLRSNA